MVNTIKEKTKWNTYRLQEIILRTSIFAVQYRIIRMFRYHQRKHGWINVSMMDLHLLKVSKEENAELLIDGKKVSNDYEFTADNEKMTVEIAFTFDGSSLGGKSLVTFEELYDMTNPDEPKKVTEHKDITDDGQTVTIKKVPEVPDTPKDTDTPDTPSTVTKTSDSPKTGDNTNIYAYLAMLGLSCVGLGGMLYFKRRRKKS